MSLEQIAPNSSAITSLEYNKVNKYISYISIRKTILWFWIEKQAMCDTKK